jgi:hypothetical protein
MSRSTHVETSEMKAIVAKIKAGDDVSVAEMSKALGAGSDRDYMKRTGMDVLINGGARSTELKYQGSRMAKQFTDAYTGSTDKSDASVSMTALATADMGSQDNVKALMRGIKANMFDSPAMLANKKKLIELGNKKDKTPDEQLVFDAMRGALDPTALESNDPTDHINRVRALHLMGPEMLGSLGVSAENVERFKTSLSGEADKFTSMFSTREMHDKRGKDLDKSYKIMMRGLTAGMTDVDARATAERLSGSPATQAANYNAVAALSEAQGTYADKRRAIEKEYDAKRDKSGALTKDQEDMKNLAMRNAYADTFTKNKDVSAAADALNITPDQISQKSMENFYDKAKDTVLEDLGGGGALLTQMKKATELKYAAAGDEERLAMRSVNEAAIKGTSEALQGLTGVDDSTKAKLLSMYSKESQKSDAGYGDFQKEHKSVQDLLANTFLAVKNGKGGTDASAKEALINAAVGMGANRDQVTKAIEAGGGFAKVTDRLATLTDAARLVQADEKAKEKGATSTSANSAVTISDDMLRNLTNAITGLEGMKQIYAKMGANVGGKSIEPAK